MSETAAHLTSHSIITLGTKLGNKEEAKNINPSQQDKIISPTVRCKYHNHGGRDQHENPILLRAINFCLLKEVVWDKQIITL